MELNHTHGVGDTGMVMFTIQQASFSGLHPPPPPYDLWMYISEYIPYFIVHHLLYYKYIWRLKIPFTSLLLWYYKIQV
jgi:hypothetical protein